MIRYQYANLDGNNVFYREAGTNTAPTIQPKNSTATTTKFSSGTV